MTAKILIVDDEEDIRGLIRGILEDEKYDVVEANDSTGAFDKIAQEKPDLIILDIWLQGSEKDGLEILETLSNKDFYTPVLMISGHGTVETAVTAIKNGAYDFIEKPFKSDRMLLMISRALETAALKNENRLLKSASEKQKHTLIGESPVIKEIREQISKVAPTNSRVLIKGEAGTGKEVIARMIHDLSPRKKKAFFALNCAALHPDRLEEELFGIQKGDESKTGMLEMAAGGTLFLDEVVDMPIETQGKILRVLQDNKIFPVGSNNPVAIDVRFIASTNQDIEESIAEGRFREDLLYRLNVVTLDMPPLRQRKDDVLLLADHFAEQFALQTGQHKRKLAVESQNFLKSYDWPGNVRQLRNVMEWVTIMMSAAEANKNVMKSDLPPDITGQFVASNDDSYKDYCDFPLREARESFEKDYLEKQIRRFDGNVSQTAEFIGMERSALHRKLKSLDISLHGAQDDKGTIQKTTSKKVS